jgi:cytidine deaminase
MERNDVDWEMLSARAWEARERSYLVGNTAVGAALITKDGQVFTGCNVEHRYRINDVHAEVNCITNMVNGGCTNIAAIVVVANRKRFTPCGSCLDWIIQFGELDCLIGYQQSPDSKVIIHSARELMPFYPE